MVRDPKPPIPPPNGSGPTGPSGAHWTPVERKVWLAAHKCPEDMMLVSKKEMMVMGDSMNQQRALTNEALGQVRALADLLGDYYERKDGLPAAVKQAVFDVARYRRATELTAQATPNLKERCAKLAASLRARGLDGPADEVSAIEDALAKQLIFLVEQMAAKPEGGK